MSAPAASTTRRGRKRPRTPVKQESQSSESRSRSITPAAAKSASTRRPSHTSSSSNPSLPNTLILGMANVSDEYVAQVKTRQGTTFGTVRDRVRLKELERMHPSMKLLTMNDKTDVEECQPNAHYKGPFSSRTALGLVQQYGHLKFHHVFLDYFRFPPGYIQVAYRDFSELLAGLVESNLVDESSEIIVPNFNELAERLRTRFQRKESKPLRRRVEAMPEQRTTSGRKSTKKKKSSSTPSSTSSSKSSATSEQVFLTYEPVQPDQYPLYSTTDFLWKTTPGAITIDDHVTRTNIKQTADTAQSFGGFIHSREIEQLRPDAPFIKIRITTDRQESQQSFQATFEPGTNSRGSTPSPHDQMPPETLPHSKLMISNILNTRTRKKRKLTHKAQLNLNSV